MGRGYSIGATSARAADLVPPHLLTATVETETPAQIDVVFDEPVVWSSLAGFGIVDHEMTGLEGSGSSWRVTLAEPLAAGDSVELTWTWANTVRDLAGNALAQDSVGVVNNIVAEPVGPRMLTATVTEADRRALVVVFDEAVLWNTLDGFALGEVGLVGVTGGGTTWTVELDEDLEPAVEYTLTWTNAGQVTDLELLGLRGSSLVVANELLGEFRYPELPRLYVQTVYELPTGGTTWRVPEEYTLQQAIDQAELGDVIVVQAGAVLSGPFTLRQKTGEGWIYIVSSDIAHLPLPGNRVSPADAAHMPRLESSNNGGEHIIGAEHGAHHYRLVGLEVTPHAGTFLYSLAQWAWDETVDENFPSHITFDRCYLHGLAEGFGQTRRGLSMHGHYMEVVDSYLADFCEAGQDTQAFAAWTGSGPYRIHNCYLEAATENLLIGGIDPADPSFVPQDIEITGNFFRKPLAWQAISERWVKNLLEFKLGVRALIRGNRFENNWVDAQVGYGILFTVRNENGNARWSKVADVTFDYNVLITSQGFSIHGRDRQTGVPSAREERIALRHNVIDVRNFGDGSDGRVFATLLELQDMAIEHNLVLSERPQGTEAMLYTAGSYMPHGYRQRDNIVQMGNYGVFGSIEGSWAGFGTAALDHMYGDSWTFDHNAMVGLAANPSDYPPSNWTPAAMANVGFVDLEAGDYRLTVGSPYHLAASDGSDLGPDIGTLESLLAHVVDGVTAGEAPNVVDAIVEAETPNAVVVTTSKAVTWAAATGFSIPGHAIAGVSGAGLRWTLALAVPLVSGEYLTLTWDGTNVVHGLTGLDLAPGSVAITNRIPDTAPPEIESAVVENADPDAVVVTTSEAVTWAAATGFSIDGHTITGVSGAGTSWTLALGEAVEYGETLTLEWDATNVVEDLSGNALAASSVSITDNVAAVPPEIESAVVENADPDAVVVTTSEAVTWAAATGFAIDGHTITGVSGAGTSWTLALGEAVEYGETLTLEWDATNVVEDLDETPLAAGSVGITNNVANPETLGLHAASVEWIDGTHVRITYDWTDADQLLDWSANGGGTLGISGGRATVTGSTANIQAMTWSLGIALTRFEANVRSPNNGGSSHVNVYCELDAAIGATYNPNPGIGGLSNSGGAHLTNGGGTVYDDAARTIAADTVYDVAFEVAESYSRWSIDDGATWFTHNWTCEVTTDGILSLGGYDGCPSWGTLVIEGEVAVP